MILIMEKVIMPMGTAAWLIKNTHLEDRQIADFCKISIRDIIDMRNKKVQIHPVDPIYYTQQLTMEEIERCTADPNSRLKVHEENYPMLNSKIKVPKEKPYLPSKMRREKKVGVLTIMKHYPMISDKDIHHLMNVPIKTVTNYRVNLEELIKEHPISESVESHISLNPLWRAIREKYNIS